MAKEVENKNQSTKICSSHICSKKGRTIVKKFDVAMFRKFRHLNTLVYTWPIGIFVRTKSKLNASNWTLRSNNCTGC